MRFEVLGPLEVHGGGETLNLGTPKARAVLAVLLCRADGPVPTSTLVDEVWGETPPRTAVKNIQLYIHQLRALLGPDRIARDRCGYRLVARRSELDARRFEDLVRVAGESPVPVAAQVLREALALWRGAEAFAEVSRTPLVGIEVHRLAELRLAALEQRINLDLLCEPSALVDELVALTDEQPLRERFGAQLMTALWASGRPDDALAAFDRTRAALRDEAGLDPGPELRSLRREILSGRPVVGRSSPRTAVSRDSEAARSF